MTPATPSRERGIIFTGPNVLAIMRGTKRQHRFILTPQPNDLLEAQIPDQLRIQVGDLIWAVDIRPIAFGGGRIGVGDDGNVYDISGSVPKRRRVAIGPKGYEEITLRHQGQQKRLRVNRLIAEAFYGSSPSSEHVCRHLDGVRRNNDPLNLDWGTPAQNSADASAAGSFSGEKGSQTRLSEADTMIIRSSVEPQAVLAERFGVTQPTISKIRAGKRRRTEHPPAPPPNLPRTHSRLTLTVTDVRVQRLGDISCADAIAEGIQPAANSATIDCDTPDPRDAYRDLWNSIHSPTAWDANPWVCAVSFTPTLPATIEESSR